MFYFEACEGNERIGRMVEAATPARPLRVGQSSVHQASAQQSAVKPLDWRKRMSDQIAYALLVYTALQIFVTMGALRGEAHSLLPYLALIVLVAAIIPSCRRFEQRWNRLSEAQSHDPALSPLYRRDLAALWALAIGLPFALTGVFLLLGLLFGAG